MLGATSPKMLWSYSCRSWGQGAESHLEQSRRRVPLQAFAQFVDLVQQEHRIVHPHGLQAVDDATGHAADVGAPARASGTSPAGSRRAGAAPPEGTTQGWEEPPSSRSDSQRGATRVRSPTTQRSVTRLSSPLVFHLSLAKLLPILEELDVVGAIR